MKLLQKILAATSVVVLATGSLIGGPVKAQNTHNTVHNVKLMRAAYYTASGLCIAKQGNSPFKELNGKKFSEMDVVKLALKYAGLPNPAAMSETDQDTVIKNQRAISQQLDSGCVNVIGPLVFIPPAAQDDGKTWMERGAGYRQECVNHLSSKYAVFNRGQLKNCMANSSIKDFMSGN